MLAAFILTQIVSAGQCLWCKHVSKQNGQQTAALNSSVFWPGKTGRGGQMKTVGSCSIDVLDSKNDFGVSAPPGEK